MNGDANDVQELDITGGNVIAEEFIDYQEKNNVREPFTEG
jgi:hypothetical protein